MNFADGIWVTVCPNCGTKNLVADNGSNAYERIFFVLKILFLGIVFQAEPGGYTGATCRACGFRRPKEPDLDPEPTT